MKVAFLKSRATAVGGLEKYTFNLLKAFAQHGCEVTLLTTGLPPTIENVHTLSLAPDSKFTLYQMSHFDHVCHKWLKANPQDVVFGMERTTGQTHYRAGNGVHATYLKRRALLDPFLKRLTFSVNPLHRKILSLEKKAFEDPDLRVLFTNSYMVRDEILNTYRTSHAKIEVVHNGVEWQKWREPFEETFKIKRDGPFQLLFIGNGYRRKGLPFLLQALIQIKHDFHLTVIGKDKNLDYFMNWSAQHGLKEKISFLGPQSNVLPYYQQADALIIPSLYDPFANVTVEALAMGLYVVSSQFNGGKEVLQDFSGTVIEDSMTIALEKAFSHPKTEESATMIRQSIKELDFSRQLDKIVQKTLQ